jgi:hypothetical protein
VRIDDKASFLSQAAYVITNPTAALAVRDPAQWPGYVERRVM